MFKNFRKKTKNENFEQFQCRTRYIQTLETLYPNFENVTSELSKPPLTEKASTKNMLEDADVTCCLGCEHSAHPAGRREAGGLRGVCGDCGHHGQDQDTDRHPLLVS